MLSSVSVGDKKLYFLPRTAVWQCPAVTPGRGAAVPSRSAGSEPRAGDISRPAASSCARRVAVRRRGR